MLNADVTVDRRDFPVRVALRVADGERVALFGPSGAGKTTVLEAIAGLVPLRAGRVEVAGRHARVQRRARDRPCRPGGAESGLLRQDPGLFPHLTVRDNLLYARSARGARTGLARRALGIDGLLGEMPARLSGGQRHRVALGRLLLAHCDVLLLDEPFASLDATLRRALTALVAASRRSGPSRRSSLPTSSRTRRRSPTSLRSSTGGRCCTRAPLTRWSCAPPPGGSPSSSATSASSRSPGKHAGGMVAGVHPDRVIPASTPNAGWP